MCSANVVLKDSDCRAQASACENPKQNQPEISDHGDQQRRSDVGRQAQSALEKAGHPATRIETRAAVTLEMVDGSPKITRSVLDVRGKVDGVDQAAFQQAAEGAKKNCPVSKALQGNVDITLQAKLV